MPPLVLQIIAIIGLITKAGPEIVKLYEQARELFRTLFAGGIITVEQQEVLMKWADEHQNAVLNGEVPPELQVEPNPK